MATLISAHLFKYFLACHATFPEKEYHEEGDSESDEEHEDCVIM